MAASHASRKQEGGLGRGGEVEPPQRLAAALEPVLFFLGRRLRLRRLRLLVFLGERLAHPRRDGHTEGDGAGKLSARKLLLAVATHGFSSRGSEGVAYRERRRETRESWGPGTRASTVPTKWAISRARSCTLVGNLDARS